MKTKKNKVVVYAGVLTLSLVIFIVSSGSKNEAGASEQTYLLKDQTANMSNLTTTAQFENYIKWGISYDYNEEKLIYQNNVIGYFYDEYEKNKFNRFRIESGTIGIRIKRDEDFSITGIEEVNISDYRNNNDGFAASYINSEVDNLNNSSTTIQTTNLDSEYFKKYQHLGIQLTDYGYLEYQGKKVKVLLDENNGVYLNQGISEKKAVYLVIMQENNDLHIHSINREDMTNLLNNLEECNDISGISIQLD